MLHACLPSTTSISVALPFINLKVFFLASPIGSMTTPVPAPFLSLPPTRWGICTTGSATWRPPKARQGPKWTMNCTVVMVVATVMAKETEATTTTTARTASGLGTADQQQQLQRLVLLALKPLHRRPRRPRHHRCCCQAPLRPVAGEMPRILAVTCRGPTTRSFSTVAVLIEALFVNLLQKIFIFSTRPQDAFFFLPSFATITDSAILSPLPRVTSPIFVFFLWRTARPFRRLPPIQQ